MFKLFKNSVILSLGAVLQRMLQIILLPIYTRFLTPADYGVISVLTVLAVVVSTVGTAGLTNGVSRYFFYAEQEQTSRDAIVWSGFGFTIASSLVAVAAMLLWSEPISRLLFDTAAHGDLIQLTGIYLLALNVGTYARTVLLLEERMAATNVWLLAEVVITVITGLYLVVYLERGVRGAVESQLIAAVVPAALYLRVTVLSYRPAWSWTLLGQMLTYSIPLVGTVFAFWLIDSSDRYVLSHYLPLTEVGLYDMGYKFGTIILIVVGSFTSAWPTFYHSSGRGQAVCEDVLKVALLVTCTCGMLLTVFSPLGLRILTGPEFVGSETVVAAVVLAYVYKVPYLVFIMGIQMKNKTLWLVGLEAVAAAFNLAGNIWLVPRYGREAAAVTTTVAYALMSLGTLWMVQRINPIPGLTARPHLVTLGVTTVALAAFMAALMRGHSYPLTAMLVALGFVAGMLLLFGVGEMKRAVRAVLRDRDPRPAA